MKCSRAKNLRFAVTENRMFFTGATACLQKVLPETTPSTQSRSKLFSSGSNSTLTLPKILMARSLIKYRNASKFTFILRAAYG